MKKNKKETTERILALAANKIRSCTKLPIDNIIFPKWSDIGLWGKILAMRVKTKEQPEGCDYDEQKFRVVMRIINGKLLITGGRPDAYAWKISKVAPYLENPSKIRFIGINSGKGILNLSQMLNTIRDEGEKLEFADMFASFNRDLFIISSEPEDRRCIEVTEELYNAGITSCVDSWMEPDENGEAEETKLFIGDFLILEGDNVYCIRHDEFMETHEIHV